ncbi:MAG: hypothetical protein WD081_02640 [Gammaproteobacteria bacterium]
MNHHNVWADSRALLCVVALTGCATAVDCPPVEHDARVVVLLDHGRHASLVIEDDAGTPIRYSYGDRRWYSDEDFSLRSGFAALFRPTPAVVTRIPIDAKPEPAAIARASGWVNEHVYGLNVDAGRADAFLHRLNQLFSDETDGFTAPHPQSYTALGNSNHRVAAWLAELGCDVGTRSPFSRWRTARQAATD